jgi:hypothetical protein
MRQMMQRLPLLILAVALLCSASASAQERFGSAEGAVSALIDAAKSKNEKAMLAVLGPEGRKVISSGDPIADQAMRDKFLASYDAKHKVEEEGDKATLIIGEDDFPFPIPVMRKDGRWSFDTGAGLDEILRRRIGRN